MKIENLTPKVQKNIERIDLDNSKKNGYIISKIPLYPNDENHLQCYTDLPCRIEKGRDEFPNKKKWYVVFENFINIETKTHSTVSSAISSAKSDYEKYLNKQLKDLKSGKLK